MKPFLLFVTMLLSSGASAQKWSVALSAGPAFPTGNFSKADPDIVSGNASTGLDIQAQTTYRVYRRWGMSVLAGYQHNGDGWVPSSSRGEYYQFWKLLAGPVYQLPLTSDWALTARALAGVERLTPLEGPRPTPFTWGGGLGARYALHKRWFIQATADYLEADYRHQETIYANNALFFSSRVHYAYNSVSTAVGLGYSL
ncbi:outer membrane beta-barrel protein [Dinghuibacter silviterrae]|uniref:Outer membrane protein with beta-barrel domain n=1 Tax=Dinghuibacter silviterrae TaxID=1539049 RepID=A0A4R8DQL7_9BACT|nr:outer membrane beta-barrel protein [Dinghuibacter silviterrae]TDX00444.1 outer membrane protein with beta-barrel domain [Dinghuibacter silviterrae]